MSAPVDEAFLADVFRRAKASTAIHGAVFRVENEDGSIAWTGETGGMHAEDRYFLTSVSKLFVTTVIMQLRAEGRIRLEDRACDYIPRHLLSGLHVIDRKDYSPEITVAHLLAHTSGIPDYLSFKHDSGKTTDELLNEGADEPLPLDTVLDRVRAASPRSRPGRKASYSNTNYRLLGVIIEAITGAAIGLTLRERVMNPLHLKDTYPFQDIRDDTPAPMYFKTRRMHIPRCMASVTAEGGIVSTARETAVLLRAFFGGSLFPKADLERLTDWRFLFLPFQCYVGIGLEKLWFPRITSPFTRIPEVLGFWGSSGAFAFYCAGPGLYFTGTANQSSGAGHAAVFKAIVRILKSAPRRGDRSPR